MIVRLQLNVKNSKESQTRLMSWYWKRKPTWREDLITCNSHPWIMFFFNWLVIIWRGVFIWYWTSKVKEVEEFWTWMDNGGGRGVLKIGLFSWTSYVYHPSLNIFHIKRTFFLNKSLPLSILLYKKNCIFIHIFCLNSFVAVY